jgi:hypothetical protein
MPFLLTEPAKAFGFVVFASGKEAEQITVSDSTKSFRAIAVVAEAADGEDQGPELAIFVFQAFKRGDGDAVSAVDVVKSFKEFRFALMIVRLDVTAAAIGLGVYLLCGFGAGNFRNSHGLPASIAGQLRLGRVRCC